MSYTTNILSSPVPCSHTLTVLARFATTFLRCRAFCLFLLLLLRIFVAPPNCYNSTKMFFKKEKEKSLKDKASIEGDCVATLANQV